MLLPAGYKRSADTVGTPNLLEDCSGLHWDLKTLPCDSIGAIGRFWLAELQKTDYDQAAAKEPQVKGPRLIRWCSLDAPEEIASLCENISRSSDSEYVIPGASLELTSTKRKESE
jgi:hypothetical protein